MIIQSIKRYNTWSITVTGHFKNQFFSLYIYIFLTEKTKYDRITNKKTSKHKYFFVLG